METLFELLVITFVFGLLVLANLGIIITLFHVLRHIRECLSDLWRAVCYHIAEFKEKRRTKR